MASIRRGYSDDFVIKNNKVGIGTSNPQESLDVVGGTLQGQDLKVTGVSTQTAFSGFLRADHQIAENTEFSNINVSSLSGEIIVGTGVTVTINEVVKETTGVGNGSGDQWFDINGNHAFVKVGTPTWNGNTFTLDGTDDYFTASGGDKDDFGFGTGDFTIEMWINAASGSIVPYDNRPASTNGDYTTIFIDSGTPHFASDGVNKISGSSGDFPANVWNHVVVSRISATTKMYINGVQKGSDYSDSTNYLGVDGRPFIGAQSRTVGGSDVNGQISIVRVYKGRGLTLAEVTSNYNAGYTATTSAVAATVDLNANVPSSYPGTVRDIDTTDITTAGGSQIDTLKVYNTFTPSSGDTNQRPYAPKPGELYYNYDFKTIEFFDGNGWRQVDNTTRSGRGVFAGGYDFTNPGQDNRATIEFIQISTLGNTSNFGDLLATKRLSSGCSSSTRGLNSGGLTPSTVDVIEYVTIASAGNSIDFGNLTVARYAVSAVSSSTRGINGGGFASPTQKNELDYVEIATIGNALDFGDLSAGIYGPAGVSNGTRGLFGGGERSSPAGQVTHIDAITIQSKGNAVKFGDLTYRTYGIAAGSNSVTGIYGGGATTLSNINKIIIASDGNVTDFGNLTVKRRSLSATASQTRVVFAGGFGSPAKVNTIDYVTIASSGNAFDFGDLSRLIEQQSSFSDSHGGLGGF